MSYVPIVTQSTRDASPRARELARQLEQVIQDFQRSYPDTKPADVQQAVQIAWGGSSSVPAARRTLVLALAGGIAALAGVLVFLSEGQGGLGELASGPMVWIVVGLLVLVALAAVARKE